MDRALALARRHRSASWRWDSVGSFAASTSSSELSGSSFNTPATWRALEVDSSPVRRASSNTGWSSIWSASARAPAEAPTDSPVFFDSHSAAERAPSLRWQSASVARLAAKAFPVAQRCSPRENRSINTAASSPE